MLVAQTSNTNLLAARRRTTSTTPSAGSGKLQLITASANNTKSTTATSSSSSTSSSTQSSSAQRSSSRSPVAIGSLCVRISRDTNGFKALLNKIPSGGKDTSTGTGTNVVSRNKHHLFTINPTITHRCPQILDIHSRDSLVADMCIFDPINPVPLTPYVRKECQSLKSPKFKYPSLKHRKFSLQINKTSSLLRVKLLKPYRPSAFCFLGSKLKSSDKINAKRAIGKLSKESPSLYGYGQLQSTNTTPDNITVTPQNLYIEKKTTKRSRGNNNIRNSSRDLQELQLSSNRPITRSFLRMMNNASKTK